MRDAAAAFRRGGLATGVLVVVALALVLFDARSRRAEVARGEPTRRALVRATGLADPFSSSSSRWLRHPSLTEPAAACLDAPDGLDVDPAGMAIGGYAGAHEPGRLERTR